MKVEGGGGEGCEMTLLCRATRRKKVGASDGGDIVGNDTYNSRVVVMVIVFMLMWWMGG